MSKKTTKTPPYRLGLDIGTNSIGWAIVDIDEKGKPIGLRDAGVRIFQQGRDPQALTTLNATRRQKRMMSRQRDRYLRRRDNVIQSLIRNGLFPKDETERKKLVPLDPYRLRTDALKKKLPIEQVGRALFHLNQRRGFKSNRKTDRGDGEKGLIHSSIEEFKKKVGDKTVGEYLHGQIKNGQGARARRHGSTQKDLYTVYADRAMLEEEFARIWKAQAKHHPKIMTDKAREYIHKAMFHQRRLKPPIVGHCQFLPDEKKAPSSLPSFQNYRIYQELNNLGWWRYGDSKFEKAHHMLVKVDDGDLTLRNILFEQFQTAKTISFKGIKKILSKHGVEDIEKFNLEEERDKLLGNQTTYLMKKSEYIGPQWNEWSLEKQDELILLLEDHELTDEEAVEKLQSEWGLDASRAENLINAPLPDGHSNLSLKAIRQITPYMRDGLLYDKAVAAAGLGHHSDRGFKGKLMPQLPPYEEVLAKDVNDFSDPSKKEDKRFPNPTVHIALNQLRRIVNELIRRYGLPASIVSEIGRDVQKGAEQLKEWNIQQSQNRKNNERINDEIKSGTSIQDPTRKDRQKYMLWEELAENPQDRNCIGCGTSIGITTLFSSKIEIEHILPFSRTLDDSMSNKTLFCQKCNRNKGERSPFEAFGQDEKRWRDIENRVENLTSTQQSIGSAQGQRQRAPRNKKWRFSSNAMERFLNSHEGDFLARQLNDMRYISRLAKNYLCVICEDITTTPGRVTSDLRYYLGYKIKDRNTHANHAIDAIVVGLTNRSILQKLADFYKEGKDLKEDSEGNEFLKRALGNKIKRSDIDAVIDNIVVSHKVSKSRGGQLHEETAYGLATQQTNEDLELTPHKAEKGIVVRHRTMLESITADTLDKIVDPKIQSELLRETDGKSGTDFNKAIAAYSARTGVRRIRVEKTLTGIPLRTHIKAWSKRRKQLVEKQGWKIYPGGNNWCYDIYETDNGKWDGEVISRYDANQKSFIPKWKRENPTKKLLMRLFIDSTLLFRKELKDDQTPIHQHIYRVQKFTPGKITLTLIHEANVDKRDRDKEDSFQFKRAGPNALKSKYDAVQVDISPTGLINIRDHIDKKSD